MTCGDQGGPAFSVPDPDDISLKTQASESSSSEGGDRSKLSKNKKIVGSNYPTNRKRRNHKVRSLSIVPTDADTASDEDKEEVEKKMKKKRQKRPRGQ